LTWPKASSLKSPGHLNLYKKVENSLDFVIGAVFLSTMLAKRKLGVESFNSKLRDELLDRELFLHIDELRPDLPCRGML